MTFIEESPTTVEIFEFIRRRVWKTQKLKFTCDSMIRLQFRDRRFSSCFVVHLGKWTLHGDEHTWSQFLHMRLRFRVLHHHTMGPTSNMRRSEALVVDRLPND